MTDKPGMKKIELGPTGQTVAKNVRRLRDGQNLTYAALSKRLTENGHRIPELGLRRIEAEARRVDADDLTALAVALDVSPLTLLLPEQGDPWTTAEITGFANERGANVLWLWGRGDEPLTVHSFPGGTEVDNIETLRFKSIAKPQIHARAISVPQAAWEGTDDEAGALVEAMRLTTAQGIEKYGRD
ncbi:helix-turn-helix domain-containing protein [Pseudoclavibacter sp. CFCC 13611]|uniref:helix-turn-helix domain-containing protein n=1 Tax=Pseudoclavibacter sp. CFCC 13611 TaxID=2615178 RepID=UPI0017879CB9|nr:helix-turn-helix transcriptional regulator [Pseudoclavibacter sp. CFCC 13611]